MKTLDIKYSRRQLLQRLGLGAAYLSLAANTPLVFGSSKPILSLRQNAAPLLLHYNENSLGMSPKALVAAKRAIELYGNRYPGESMDEFRTKLAAYHQVKPEQLIFGNGSTEVLQAIATYGAQQDACMIEPTPTFGALRRYCKAENLKVIQVPVGQDFEMNIAAMKKQAMAQTGAVLINICNPNNPTGNIVDFSVLFEWINNAPDTHMFLLDEAYFAYAQANPHYKSGLALINQGNDNVVISRTFSKVHGMAGMRIGYGISTIKTASKIKPFALGFNLSAAGIAAASAALDDIEFYKKSIKYNQLSKTLLVDTLNELELPYIPSDTNFVLHRIRTPLSEYAAHMQQNGIRVGRKMTTDDKWNRISLGTPDEMKVFTDVLLEFRKKGWV
ncbi:MAG: histidinol-phosphate aminotransferase [Alphaproteobacteria bacterium]|jgi:histidinol-phosphate aminotransferase